MKRASLLLTLVALAASAGCASVPTPRYYQLRAGGDVAAAAAARKDSGPSLGVREFTVDPPYDQERIVYRVGSEVAEVGFYAYHRWAAPLSRMLPAVVAGALADTPGLGRIEPARPGSGYDAILEGRLLALEEVDAEGVPSVHVSLVLRLEDAEGAELWSGPVAASSTLNTDDVADLVGEINRLLVEQLRSSSSELVRALR